MTHCLMLVMDGLMLVMGDLMLVMDGLMLVMDDLMLVKGGLMLVIDVGPTLLWPGDPLPSPQRGRGVISMLRRM